MTKEESEPMRGRWSPSNFPSAIVGGGGGGRGEIDHPGHFLSGGFTPLIIASHQNTLFVLHLCNHILQEGVVSPSPIFVQTHPDSYSFHRG